MIDRIASLGWTRASSSASVLIGATLGVGGSLGPFALFDQPGVTLVDCVAAVLALAGLLAVVVVPVLVIVAVAGADDDDLIRDCFLSRQGAEARLHLLASAACAWGVIVAIGLASGLTVAITSSVARSGVSREVGDLAMLWEPTLVLLAGSVYAVLLGFAVALMLGNQRIAVVVHTTLLMSLPTIAAVSDSAAGRLVACALPAAPVWGRLGEAEVGPMALEMTAAAFVISAGVWAFACIGVVVFSLRHLGGLSIAAWARGV
ncbi:hypothetical protein ACIRN4_13275 [Pimelobacter simplex]|uniref:hypothetical protein n=1 Tax=Nocardioides simplex TaxID=2045 RepID=UPI0037F1E096